MQTENLIRNCPTSCTPQPNFVIGERSNRSRSRPSICLTIGQWALSEALTESSSSEKQPVHPALIPDLEQGHYFNSWRYPIRVTKKSLGWCWAHRLRTHLVYVCGYSPSMQRGFPKQTWPNGHHHEWKCLGLWIWTSLMEVQGTGRDFFGRTYSESLISRPQGTIGSIVLSRWSNI